MKDDEDDEDDEDDIEKSDDSELVENARKDDEDDIEKSDDSENEEENDQKEEENDQKTVFRTGGIEFFPNEDGVKRNIPQQHYEAIHTLGTPRSPTYSNSSGDNMG
jgi:hypothetical protein